MIQISNKIKLISILSASPFFTYIIGAMWLNEYYKNFNVDFFKYSGPAGVVQTLFSNMEMLFYIFCIGSVFIALVMFGSVVVAFLLRLFLMKMLGLKSEQKQMDLLFLILAISGILSLYGCLYVADLVARIEASKISKSFNDKNYLPVDIYLGGKKTECLYVLGVVGDYKAFIKGEVTMLIKDSEITRIDVKPISSCN